MQIAFQQMVRYLKDIKTALTGGSNSDGTANKYLSVPLNLTASTNLTIPAGVLSWSVTATSGTNTTVNLKPLAAGQTMRSGGYVGRVSAAAITVQCGATSTAVIIYDLPVPA